MARCGDGLAQGEDLGATVEVCTRQALDALAAADRRAAAEATGDTGRSGAPTASDPQPPDLACVFVRGGSTEEAEHALGRARELTGARVVLGATAGGVIGDGRGVEAGRAASAWVARLPGAQLRPYSLEVTRTDTSLAVVGMPPRRAGDAVALLVADPWSFPVDGFVARSKEALGGLPLVGGLAAGGDTSGSTRLLVNDRVVARGAVGVVLSGPLSGRTLVSQGCRPVGPPMTVTAAEGNALLGLAGAPALEKVKEVVRALDPADQALASAGLQVGIAMDEYADEHGRGDFLVRGLIGMDASREAVLVGDVVAVGRTVRLHVRDAAAAEADLARTLRALRAAGKGAAVAGGLLFTGMGRGTKLFPTADHDVTAVRSELDTAAVAGFFAAGEIGPVAGRNHLHGFTASALLFSEGPTGEAAKGGPPA